MYPVGVLAVGVFLFLRALLVLSALPYFPVGHDGTLFTTLLSGGTRWDTVHCPTFRWDTMGHYLLPYFPVGHDGTLFTWPLCHSLKADSCVPYTALGTKAGGLYRYTGFYWYA